MQTELKLLISYLLSNFQLLVYCEKLSHLSAHMSFQTLRDVLIGIKYAKVCKTKALIPFYLLQVAS